MNPIAAAAVQASRGSGPMKRIAAGVLVTDDRDRVLLLQPSSMPTWMIPGGTVAAGESPRGAVRRALQQSLGLEMRIGRLLVVDWLPEAPSGEALVFVYDGGVLESGTPIRLDHAEMNAYGFVDLDGAMGLASERAERRWKLALDARRRGAPVLELEDGRLQGSHEPALSR